MVHTISNTIYKAFGYSIQSDIPLPELQQIDNPESDINITIHCADLTERWLELSVSPKKFVVTKNLIMFWIPDLAVFAVEGGTTITISPEKGADEDKIRLYILGSCMGAILLQRRILPLHGSAVVIDHKAYAFIGDSGHGKSTLASSFIQRGFQLLTDDVIAVTLDIHNIPYVTPAYPQQKLWQESLDTFGMNSDQFRPLFERETKYAIPVASHFSADTLPLAGIFELIKMDCSHTGIRAIEKLERLPLLYRHTYRNFFLPDSGLTQWHFETTARMSGSIEIYQLRRPLNESTVHQLTDMILSAIGK
ncbi:aldolase [Paenibacillus sp. IHBB 10380]|uniref:aldolase n=1 Tax=Paenibacillus sp. IHBB 10380 TaxID=1566358 RepID=UPI0005CFE131|nr:aldolase [Paenibacillus sp. IHBB 10380]AJS59973.1 aldolase [Paenibacillus sp. IHBB 10380]